MILFFSSWQFHMSSSFLNQIPIKQRPKGANTLQCKGYYVTDACLGIMRNKCSEQDK